MKGMSKQFTQEECDESKNEAELYRQRVEREVIIRLGMMGVLEPVCRDCGKWNRYWGYVASQTVLALNGLDRNLKFLPKQK